MTGKAREVLDDCRIALAMLEEETNLQRWRITWAGAVALTRAVGHVLDKADGASDPKVKRAANAAYQRWKSNDPEHEIFRFFIESERNNILKQYQFNIHPLDAVEVAVRMTLRQEASGEMKSVDTIIPIDENIYRPVLDGYREGDDARDVLADAIEWWERELRKIEKTRP